MPKRSEKRDTAKAAYVERKNKGEQFTLKEFAQSQGVSYQLVRKWKAADEWDKATEKPKKKRGGQPGNRNSAGHKNAEGSHAGAPEGNKNAEKDGAYSAVLLDMLTDKEKEVADKAPTGSKEALVHEMMILKVREYRVLEKIAEYEKKPEEELFISSVLDMRVPAGRGENKKDGASQQMGMYTKDSAFARVLKLQEALYKIQGRIAKITDSIRASEEYEARMEIEKQKLEILRMRATGAVDIGDEDEEGIEVGEDEELTGGGT